MRDSRPGRQACTRAADRTATRTPSRVTSTAPAPGSRTSSVAMPSPVATMNSASALRVRCSVRSDTLQAQKSPRAGPRGAPAHVEALGTRLPGGDHPGRGAHRSPRHRSRSLSWCRIMSRPSPARMSIGYLEAVATHPPHEDGGVWHSTWIGPTTGVGPRPRRRAPGRRRGGVRARPGSVPANSGAHTRDGVTGRRPESRARGSRDLSAADRESTS